ncbi:hypothetical protein [Arcticibacterium luteifluviistationis]|uniref:Uncharacterized protein n=1 Tax=Arcticibacterium luteifluviistationis TaxID=1784714 RepID=A0A2Z4GBQ9_9BACT|nr:hypothetical protein [Arcticibacterium luteifluviistationis]AWV98500.1 hypothetical protein DJ013_10080 [Arcticibacterium luteifluviistationis]
MRENHVITQAKIVEYLPGAHNGGAFIDYTFNYENVLHESSIGAKNDWRKLIGMEFPLIFEKNKPENNQILILSEHFEEFELAFPDSLKWTEKLKR